MKLTMLGTGAAEAVPDPFCSCRVCEVARRDGGREVRARAAALVNDDLLIDLGPDLLTSANMARKFLGGVETLLVTHRHEDHWLPQNLHWRHAGFTPTPMAHLTIYGPADALEALDPRAAELAHMSWRAVSGGDRWTAGRYHITAVPATHGGGQLEPLLYVIENEGRRIFYATDTGPLQEPAWAVLRGVGRLDLVVLDATSGHQSGGEFHHGLAQFVETRARMVAAGLVVPGVTRVLAHHFSHNGGMTHSELVEAYGHHETLVAYDGMELTLP